MTRIGDAAWIIFMCVYVGILDWIPAELDFGFMEQIRDGYCLEDMQTCMQGHLDTHTHTHIKSLSGTKAVYDRILYEPVKRALSCHAGHISSAFFWSITFQSVVCAVTNNVEATGREINAQNIISVLLAMQPSIRKQAYQVEE